MERKPRVLLAKVGCDIHERGALTMMKVYRDAGIEVIYTGRYQTEENVVKAAVAEDVDLIAVSDLSGSMPIIAQKILDGLKELGVEIPLVCGGLMTDEDMEVCRKMGVAGCFETGSSIDASMEVVRKMLGMDK